MMFRHQRIGSRQHGRDCRLLRASRVSVALLSLSCGLAGAADYGEIDVMPANDSQWSTLLSNNPSTVQGNILVMNCSSSRSISVKSGAAMNLTCGSKINHTGAFRYDWRHERGSAGSLTDSTIKGNVSEKKGTEARRTLDTRTGVLFSR